MYLILLFDTREDTYTIINHNMTEEAAEAEMHRLRDVEKLPAFFMHQSKHTGLNDEASHEGDAERCPDCEREITFVFTERGHLAHTDEEAARLSTSS